MADLEIQEAQNMDETNANIPKEENANGEPVIEATSEAPPGEEKKTTTSKPKGPSFAAKFVS